MLTTTPIAHDDLTDLRMRLERTRTTAPGAAPCKGISPERLSGLVHAWLRLDWRAAEAEYDRLGSTLTETADGRRLHYLHARAEGDGLPIVLLHGWPDTPWQFRRLIPLLTAAGHDVVAPSAAGFGFSEEPSGELSPDLVAGDVHDLVLRLGYSRYAVHGTDWGATVGATLADTHPDAVAALHLLQPPFDRAFFVDRAEASEAERTYLEGLDTWSETAAYVSAHTHQADTLAAAFADSPVGLLAWIAEKYDAWSGEGIRDEDILLATATLWLTDSFRSSVRLYSEPAGAWGGVESDDWTADAPAGAPGTNAQDPGADGASAPATSDHSQGDWDATDSAAWAPARIEVPTAFAIFPADIATPPREFAERFFAVQRFTVMPRGGHWAALEEPALLAEDLLAFVDQVQSRGGQG